MRKAMPAVKSAYVTSVKIRCHDCGDNGMTYQSRGTRLQAGPEHR